MSTGTPEKQAEAAIAEAQAAAFQKLQWTNNLRKTENGKVIPSQINTLTVLENDVEWRGVIGFDEFSYRIVKQSPPPIRVAKTGEWTDLDDVLTLVYVSEEYHFEPKKQYVMDAVLAVAYQNSFHPVRDYLNTRVWDEKPRLLGLLAKYFGAFDTPLTASLGETETIELGLYLKLASLKWLVGAVARIMEPGCKLDTMVVLEGGQGDFKSTALRRLFGNEWFADSKLVIGDKDALAQMQGKWCYEMAEMDSHSKADNTAFKQFLSSQMDRVRWHYGRRAEDVPRQCVFAGTTNMDEYGKDDTGMRRIWPAHVGFIDLEALTADRDQLWAEAMHYYRKGARWWVDKSVIVIDPDKPQYAGLFDAPISERELFDRQAEDRMHVDAWSYRICDWLKKNDLLPHVTTAQILGDALGLEPARWSKPEQMRAAAILRRLGYSRQKCGPKTARFWAFVPSKATGVPSASHSTLEGDDDLPI